MPVFVPRLIVRRLFFLLLLVPIKAKTHINRVEFDNISVFQRLQRIKIVKYLLPAYNYGINQAVGIEEISKSWRNDEPKKRHRRNQTDPQIHLLPGG